MAGEERADGDKDRLADVASETGDNWPGIYVHPRVVGKAAT